MFLSLSISGLTQMHLSGQQTRKRRKKPLAGQCGKARVSGSCWPTVRHRGPVKSTRTRSQFREVRFLSAYSGEQFPLGRNNQVGIKHCWGFLKHSTHWFHFLVLVRIYVKNGSNLTIKPECRTGQQQQESHWREKDQVCLRRALEKAD